MPKHSISITDGGGISITVTDEDDVEREIILEPNDDGTIDIQGRGLNGKSQRGTIAPGKGDHPLGK